MPQLEVEILRAVGFHVQRLDCMPGVAITGFRPGGRADGWRPRETVAGRWTIRRFEAGDGLAVPGEKAVGAQATADLD